MLVMEGQGGGRDARFNIGYNMSLLSGETSPELYTGGTHRPGALNAGLGRQGLLPTSCSSGLPRGIKRSSSDVCFDQDVRSVQPLSINTDLSPDVADDAYSQGQQNKKTPPPNGKKTKGRVKIKMEYIDNKLRRYTTFSKRKTGIMKKAYELSTLTGTQVMLLVASETGHVYTFATRKLQPMITSEAGKALIQTCLNSPDPAPSAAGGDQRMSATGFEETELTYNISDEEQKEDGASSNSDDEGSIGDAESGSGGESPDGMTCDDNASMAGLLSSSGYSGMAFPGNNRPSHMFSGPTSLPNGVIFSLSPQIDPGGVNGVAGRPSGSSRQFITLPYTLTAGNNQVGDQAAADLTTSRK